MPEKPDREQLYWEALGKPEPAPAVLVATGGLCAPLSPVYKLYAIPLAARPLREVLPDFEVRRGTT